MGNFYLDFPPEAKEPITEKEAYEIFKERILDLQERIRTSSTLKDIEDVEKGILFVENMATRRFEILLADAKAEIEQTKKSFEEHKSLISQ